jgi:hypothetical protein
VSGGEAVELELKPINPLAELETLGGRALGTVRFGAVELSRIDRLRPASRQLVESGVVRDPQEPGPEGRVPPELLQSVEGSQERVLADVLGLVVAHDPGGNAHDDVPMTLDEPLERGMVAPRDPGDEDIVLVSAMIVDGRCME